ncbi:MAG: histidine kinase, partial [Ignavibacteriales bacterium]
MQKNKNYKWLKPVFYIIFWFSFGLYFTSEVYIYYAHNNEDYSFFFISQLIMPEALIWAFLGIGVIKLTKLFPLSNKPYYKNIIIHILGSVVFALAHSVLLTFSAEAIGACQQMPYFIGRPFDFEEHFIFNLMLRFHRNVITYAAIVGALQGFQYYKRFRDREILAVKLEKELTEARLTTLRLQLQPHFLFNTMHTISSLIHVKPEVA